jgi:hypothetical protein
MAAHILRMEGFNILSIKYLRTARKFEDIYRLSQEQCARIRDGVPYVKVCRYNPKHLRPKLNGYGDNGPRKVLFSGGSTHCTCQLISVIDVCF